MPLAGIMAFYRDFPSTTSMYANKRGSSSVGPHRLAVAHAAVVDGECPEHTFQGLEVQVALTHTLHRWRHTQVLDMIAT